jgi:hypothetical protein
MGTIKFFKGHNPAAPKTLHFFTGRSTLAVKDFPSSSFYKKCP